MMNPIVPRNSISIRPAVAGDLAFMDRLQQMHSKAVGFMPTKQLEQKIERGEVLVAEDEMRLPIGYCISADRYFKRDEVGIIYQMNVSPSAQRKLVAASLLKSVFERAPYGCRLFCCWCAQDLEANYFWESMGFVPLAFRTGAVGKKGAARTHIFWQRRIREGDTTTPFWYPCKTDGGSLRGDRLVLPIPPDVNWRDAMPVLLPEAQKVLPEAKADGGLRTKKPVKLRPGQHDPSKGPLRIAQGQMPPVGKSSPQPVVQQPAAKPPRPARTKAKVDPVLLNKSRELRDRYLERFNTGLVLPAGKYAVGRVLPIADCPVPIEKRSNRQLEMGNGQSLAA